MDHHAHIFVGFGGSGCETLAQLAEMLSDDARLCPMADTNYFFILIDTDLDDMKKKFKRSEDALRRGSVDPHCQMVALAENAERFSAMVQKYFSPGTVRGAAYSVHEEIRNHWWHSGGGDPFDAPKLTESLSHGAGQCPAVSYFLGWRYIEKFEMAIESCVEQMKIRKLGTPRENITATLHLVSGLSGGTGRGCWHLFSVKAREILSRAGVNSQAIGYFFDQSMMVDVTRTNPGRQLQMKLNSLSGLSELIMWLRNDERQSDKRNYVLPSVRAAGDPDRAVTNLSRISQQKAARGWSPVDVAWIIGGSSRTVPAMSLKEDYYRMVGGALYSRLLQSAVKSGTSNEPANLGSLAVAIAMVPTMAISRWLVDEAKRRMVDHVLGVPVEGTSYLPAELGQLDQLGSASMLTVTQPESSKEFDRFKPEVRRILKFERTLEVFDGHMKSQNVPKAEDCKKGICDEPMDFPKELQAAVRKQLLDKCFGKRSVADWLSEKSVMDITALNIHKDELGLAGSRANLAATAAHARKVARHLIGQEAVLRESRKQACAEFHTHFENDKKRERILSKTFFTEQERTRLVDKAEEVLAHDSAIALCKVLAAELESLADTAARLEGTNSSAAQELEQALAREMLEFDAGAHAIRFAETFSTSEANIDRNCRDETFLRVRTARRIFRPHCDELRAREIARELLDRAAENPKYESESKKLFQIVSVCASGRGSDDKARQSRIDKLRSCIRAMQEQLVVPVDLLAKHFSVCAVLGDLVPQWVSALNGAKGARRNELKLFYSRLFGHDCPQEGGEFVAAQLQDVVSHLAADLAACCDPFIKFEAESDQGRERGDEVAVFLPADEQLANMAASIKDSAAFQQHKLSNSASVIEAKGDQGTPFALVAFAQERMNYGDTSAEDNDRRHIDFTSTLDYWRGPELKSRLEDLERQDGRGFFSPPSDSYGFGYLAPFMVRDPYWSSLRWAPWASRSRGIEEAEKAAAAVRHYEAMAWLLAGLGDAEPDEEDGIPVGVILKEVAAKHKWDLVNLQRSDGSAFELTRELYESTGGRVRPTDGTVGPDTPGFRELTSLRPLAESLAANPDAVDAVLRERELFFGICEDACKKRYVPIEHFRAALHGRVLAFVQDEKKRARRLRGPAAKPILETVDALLAVVTRLAEPSEA